jgi:hypothetical protein
VSQALYRVHLASVLQACPFAPCDSVDTRFLTAELPKLWTPRYPKHTPPLSLLHTQSRKPSSGLETGIPPTQSIMAQMLTCLT